MNREDQIKRNMNQSVMEVVEQMKRVNPEDRSSLFFEWMEELCFSDEDILLVPQFEMEKE